MELPSYMVMDITSVPRCETHLDVFNYAGVAELVDASDLSSDGHYDHEGSNPSSCT